VGLSSWDSGRGGCAYQWLHQFYLMKMSTALLFQCPRSLMLLHEIPFALAVTAAPLQKEWHEKPVALTLIWRSKFLTLSITKSLVNGPADVWNRG
jgi:hypothetical protein